MKRIDEVVDKDLRPRNRLLCVRLETESLQDGRLEVLYSVQIRISIEAEKNKGLQR